MRSNEGIVLMICALMVTFNGVSIFSNACVISFNRNALEIWCPCCVRMVVETSFTILSSTAYSGLCFSQYR
ncbi:hypothetical protein BC829DRAFT_383384 [Chytridium lagenaria]|nr:hypothetical protein BC829DRAFT_383384 [Chytridium lagenaria]